MEPQRCNGCLKMSVADRCLPWLSKSVRKVARIWFPRRKARCLRRETERRRATAASKISVGSSVPQARSWNVKRAVRRSPLHPRSFRTPASSRETQAPLATVVSRPPAGALRPNMHSSSVNAIARPAIFSRIRLFATGQRHGEMRHLSRGSLRQTRERTVAVSLQVSVSLNEVCVYPMDMKASSRNGSGFFKAGQVSRPAWRLVHRHHWLVQHGKKRNEIKRVLRTFHSTDFIRRGSWFDCIIAMRLLLCTVSWSRFIIHTPGSAFAL